MGCVNDRIAMPGQITITLIVGHDEDHIGPLCGVQGKGWPDQHAEKHCKQTQVSQVKTMHVRVSY